MNRIKQRGAISGGVIALIVVALVALISVPSYISAKNFGVRTENGLRTKVENNENIYAQGTQKVMEIAQVPAMYADDLKKVVTAAIQGRYGDKGSQATFQWIQEQNPTVDPSMYKKIQQVIEAFRNEFQQAQTEMLQMRNTYENALGYFWQGMWLSAAGYPKIDLSQFKIVTTDKARQTFETKRDSGITLRPVN
jgi:uncharacterized protein (UPF0333 family)